MITLKSNLKTFELKTSLSDLSFREYQELLDENTSEHRKVEILTGLNEFEAEIHDLEILSPYLLDLLKNPFETIDPIDFVEIEGKTILMPEDIADKEWGQKIMAVQNLIEGNYLRMVSTYIQPLFDGDQYDDDKCQPIDDKLSRLPAETVFGLINYIRDQIKKLSDHENELLKSETTPEQKRAGIEMFEQLGEFNTIDLIAGGDVLKYPAVLRVDYNTILNKLFKLNITAKFERNYNEIIKEKTT